MFGSQIIFHTPTEQHGGHSHVSVITMRMYFLRIYNETNVKYQKKKLMCKRFVQFVFNCIKITVLFKKKLKLQKYS